MKLGWAVLGVVALVVGGGLFVHRTLTDLIRPPTPPLPGLLLGATATGGGFPGCMEGEAGLRRQPQSPEIATRLAQLAPPGSHAMRLTDILSRQGFGIDPHPCADLPGVHKALFMQQPSGGLTYAARASIWWSEDEDGRIQWTSGNIVYRGL